MLAAILTGFSVSLGLILAIGAQNAFVLRQGLKGEHVAAVVLICALSDAIAMSIGIGFFALVSDTFPMIEPLMRYGGAAFLIVYGLLSLHSALTAHGALAPTDQPARPLLPTILTCLAFTWLNPHFYLDTMVLVGSISTRFPGHELLFGAGAVTASFVFFVTLGFGARLLRPVLATPRAWRILDALIGCVMLAIAVRLMMG